MSMAEKYSLIEVSSSFACSHSSSVISFGGMLISSRNFGSCSLIASLDSIDQHYSFATLPHSRTNDYAKKFAEGARLRFGVSLLELRLVPVPFKQLEATRASVNTLCI